MTAWRAIRISATRRQNVVEDDIGAEAVVPGHAGEVERGLDMAAGKRRFDASPAFLAPLLTADSQ